MNTSKFHNILIVCTLYLSSSGPFFGESFVLYHHYTSIPQFKHLFSSPNPNNYRSGAQGDDYQPMPHDHSRRAEFNICDTTDDSDVRRKRKQRESSQKQRFAAFGNDLWDLRDKIFNLSNKLIDAVASEQDTSRIRREIKEAEQRDPEAVYTMELEAMNKAIDEGRDEDAKKHSEQAVFARDYLTQYNLEGKSFESSVCGLGIEVLYFFLFIFVLFIKGLWIGKYGDGYQLINITYSDEVLIAKKVTGSRNVPADEISFQVDLSPRPNKGSLSNFMKETLPNIVLSEAASLRWGTRELQRFNGIGQVSDETFSKREWMDGQLVLINEDYFSFSWVPLSHQIFFGRPSPAMALKMLKDKEMHHSPLKSSKEHVHRCFDVTLEMIEECPTSIILDECCFE
jgi:hypothetical protein